MAALGFRKLVSEIKAESKSLGHSLRDGKLWAKNCCEEIECI